MVHSLKRDGSAYRASLNYDFALKPQLHLTPELRITRGSFEGESNSFWAYGVALRLLYITGPMTLMPYMIYSMSRYDEAHPIFNEKRDESSFGAILMASYAHPFGLRDYFIRLILGYSNRSSNINFFDSSGKFSGITFGYKF
jgi:hypothetical protein